MFYMLIKTKYEGFFSETLTGSISGSAAPIEGGAKSFMQTSKGGAFPGLFKRRENMRRSACDTVPADT